jgi:hypothetical protein
MQQRSLLISGVVAEEVVVVILALAVQVGALVVLFIILQYLQGITLTWLWGKVVAAAPVMQEVRPVELVD